ncbi:hypothetical protein ACQ4PT_022065 [Festuca glaucescens]
MGAGRAPLPAGPQGCRRHVQPTGVPFRYGRRGCSMNLRYADDKEKEELKRKATQHAKVLKAVGPSHNRKLQQKLDRATQQGKASKGNGGGADINKKRAGGGKKKNRGRQGEDDIHKGIKYNVWASTPNGNNKLDAAFHDAQALTKEKGTKCPVFLLFSVNTSGQFVGMAEMLGPVDFKKTMDFWQQNKWSGFFPVVWHIIKDIPNRLFKHITLENNDNRPVTFSRDTQEIGLPQGLEVLKIFKAYRHGTSILDDFDFYEEKDNTRCAQKGINADSLHEARVSYFGTDDLKSTGDIEASMESINLHEPWD